MRFKLTWKWYFLFSALGVILAVASVALVCELDMLVNGLLYEYGLVFDHEWALPYWSILRSILAMLAILAVLNSVPTSYLFITRLLPMFKRKFVQVASTGGKQSENAVDHVDKQKAAEAMQNSVSKQETQRTLETANAIEIMAVPMICNKCGKVFNQPLCMFDFKSGKPRLVHVCPYCNAVLAVSGSSEDK